MNPTPLKPRSDQFAPRQLSPSGIDPAIGRRVRAGNALIGELVALAAGHGELIAHEERSWASVTFKGVRHRVTIAFEGQAAIDGAYALEAALPEHEFAIPGWLVADAKMVAVNMRFGSRLRAEMTAELLLVESD